MIGVIRKFKTASPAVKASMALLFANLILKGISLISGPIFTRIMSADQYGDSFNISILAESADSNRNIKFIARCV